MGEKVDRCKPKCVDIDCCRHDILSVMVETAGAGRLRFIHTRTSTAAAYKIVTQTQQITSRHFKPTHREGCDDEACGVTQVLVAVHTLRVEHAHQQRVVLPVVSACG